MVNNLMHMAKVFIIGNGFDLDLGWKTRYSDFASSKYWIEGQL